MICSGGRRCKEYFPRFQMGYPEQVFSYFELRRASFFLCLALPALSVAMSRGY
jgi:hypothetical protein